MPLLVEGQPPCTELPIRGIKVWLRHYLEQEPTLACKTVMVGLLLTRLLRAPRLTRGRRCWT